MTRLLRCAAISVLPFINPYWPLSIRSCARVPCVRRALATAAWAARAHVLGDATNRFFFSSSSSAKNPIEWTIILASRVRSPRAIFRRIGSNSSSRCKSLIRHLRCAGRHPPPSGGLVGRYPPMTWSTFIAVNSPSSLSAASSKMVLMKSATSLSLGGGSLVAPSGTVKISSTYLLNWSGARLAIFASGAACCAALVMSPSAQATFTRSHLRFRAVSSSLSYMPSLTSSSLTL